MSPVSAEVAERSRKVHSAILQALARVGQATLARETGASEATISRWKSEQAEQCAIALAALGLKAVPVTHRCYSPETVQALLTLARAKLDEIDKPEELAWD